MVQHPTSKGYIKLSTANPFDKPIIDPNYLDTEYDMDCFISGCEKMMEILESDVFKNLGCKVIYINGHENIKDKRELHSKEISNWTHTIYHPVGTCKMGNIDITNDISYASQYNTEFFKTYALSGTIVQEAIKGIADTARDTIL